VSTVITPDSSNPICQWPLNERPRERLMHQGAAALSDAELLAIFLRTGIPGLSAVALARQLLVRFGSLGGLMGAARTEVCAAPGVGDAKWALLQASHELARRVMVEPLAERSLLNSPPSVQAYLQQTLRGRLREVFMVLLLDTQHRLIEAREMFEGSVSRAAVYPREIVRAAMQANASAVIVAHNHPSGVAEPSAADNHITEAISKALALVEVRLIDHLIVAGPQVVSFAARGWL
jgi:DNA repair protein RadC